MLTLEQINQIRAKSGVKPLDSTGKAMSTSLVDDLGLNDTPAEAPVEDKPNYIERVGTSFKEAGQDIKSAVMEGAEKYNEGVTEAGQADSVLGNAKGILKGATGLVESGLRTAGEVAGAAAAPIVEAVSPVVSSLVSKIPGLDKVAGKVNEFAQKYPDASKDLEAIFNLATLGTGKAVEQPVATALKQGADKALDATKTFVREGLEQDAKELAQVASEKSTKEAIDVTKPALNALEREAALKEGRVQTTGILGKREVLPSKLDQRVAKSVENLVNDGRVKTSNAPEVNIEAISKEVSSINKDVKKYVSDNKSPFNTTQLKKKLSDVKEDSRLIFAGDASLEKTYDAVIEEFIKNVDSKDTLGLFEARQNFDKIPAVKKLLDSISNLPQAENLKRSAVLDVRRAANDYIADLLPEGNKFKELLRKESDMIRAIENIANASRNTINTTKFTRLFQKYPWLKTVLPSGIVGGAIGTAIAN